MITSIMPQFTVHSSLAPTQILSFVFGLIYFRFLLFALCLVFHGSRYTFALFRKFEFCSGSSIKLSSVFCPIRQSKAPLEEEITGSDVQTYNSRSLKKDRSFCGLYDGKTRGQLVVPMT